MSSMFYNKAYDSRMHGPINWFPVFVVLVMLLNILLLIGGTYLTYNDTVIDQETIDRRFGGGYELITVNADAEQFHIALLEDADGSLYYAGFHKMELMDRFGLVTGKAKPVTADGTTRHQVKSFAGSVAFRVTPNKAVITDASSGNMNVIQRYTTCAVVMLIVEIALYILIKVGLKKLKNRIW